MRAFKPARLIPLQDPTKYNSLNIHPSIATMNSRPVLFKDATIIAYDTSKQSLKILRNASLLVENGRIAKLSESDIEAPSGAEVVDGRGKIISPGFVDTHHHMWMSAFRTLSPDTTLSQYMLLYRISGTASDHFTPEDVYLGQLAGLYELIDCGTTAVLDHAHGSFSDAHIDAAVNATIESGVRCFFAMDIITIGNYTFDQCLAKYKSLQADARFHDSNVPAELAIAYDGFLFGSPEQTAQIAERVKNPTTTSGKQSPAVLTTHMVAGPYGANNSPTLLSAPHLALLSQTKVPIVFSHASFMTPADYFMLKQNNAHSISTTSESEAHYGQTSTGAELSQTHTSLGVDTHFTFSSYMPTQARLWLQLQRSKRFEAVVRDNWNVPSNNPMSVESAFLLATQKGGEALGRSDIGVINEGAQADIVVYDTEKIGSGLWGWKDPVAAIVLHTGSAKDVDAVMVAGRWLKKDGKFVAEVDEFKKKFEESAKRIQSIWAERGEEFEKRKGFPFIGAPCTCQQIDIRRQRTT